MTFVTFGVSFVESGRFVREGRTCNIFSVVKYILFVSIRTVNGHSVREWRASLFFPMVKLDDFYIFLRKSGSKMVLFDQMGRSLLPAWPRLVRGRCVDCTVGR